MSENATTIFADNDDLPDDIPLGNNSPLLVPPPLGQSFLQPKFLYPLGAVSITNPDNLSLATDFEPLNSDNFSNSPFFDNPLQSKDSGAISPSNAQVNLQTKSLPSSKKPQVQRSPHSQSPNTPLQRESSNPNQPSSFSNSSQSTSASENQETTQDTENNAQFLQNSPDLSISSNVPELELSENVSNIENTSVQRFTALSPISDVTTDFTDIYPNAESIDNSSSEEYQNNEFNSQLIQKSTDTSNLGIPTRDHTILENRFTPNSEKNSDLTTNKISSVKDIAIPDIQRDSQSSNIVNSTKDTKSIEKATSLDSSSPPIQRNISNTISEDIRVSDNIQSSQAISNNIDSSSLVSLSFDNNLQSEQSQLIQRISNLNTDSNASDSIVLEGDHPILPSSNLSSERVDSSSSQLQEIQRQFDLAYQENSSDRNDSITTNSSYSSPVTNISEDNSLQTPLGNLYTTANSSIESIQRNLDISNISIEGSLSQENNLTPLIQRQIDISIVDDNSYQEDTLISNPNQTALQRSTHNQLPQSQNLQKQSDIYTSNPSLANSIPENESSPVSNASELSNIDLTIQKKSDITVDNQNQSTSPIKSSQDDTNISALEEVSNSNEFLNSYTTQDSLSNSQINNDSINTGNINQIQANADLSPTVNNDIPQNDLLSDRISKMQPIADSSPSDSNLTTDLNSTVQRSVISPNLESVNVQQNLVSKVSEDFSIKSEQLNTNAIDTNNIESLSQINNSSNPANLDPISSLGRNYNLNHNSNHTITQNNLANENSLEIQRVLAPFNSNDISIQNNLEQPITRDISQIDIHEDLIDIHEDLIDIEASPIIQTQLAQDNLSNTNRDNTGQNNLSTKTSNLDIQKKINSDSNSSRNALTQDEYNYTNVPSDDIHLQSIHSQDIQREANIETGAIVSSNLQNNYIQRDVNDSLQKSLDSLDNLSETFIPNEEISDIQLSRKSANSDRLDDQIQRQMEASSDNLNIDQNLIIPSQEIESTSNLSNSSHINSLEIERSLHLPHLQRSSFNSDGISISDIETNIDHINALSSSPDLEIQRSSETSTINNLDSLPSENINTLTDDHPQILSVENSQPLAFNLGVDEGQSIQRQLDLDSSNSSVEVNESDRNLDVQSAINIFGADERILSANASSTEASSEISSNDNSNISTNSISNEIQREFDTNTNKISNTNEINARDNGNIENIYLANNANLEKTTSTNTNIQKSQLDSESSINKNINDIGNINILSSISNQQSLITHDLPIIDSNTSLSGNVQELQRNSNLNDPNIDLSNNISIQDNNQYNQQPSQSIDNVNNTSISTSISTNNLSPQLQRSSDLLEGNQFNREAKTDKILSQDEATQTDQEIEQTSELSVSEPNRISQEIQRKSASSIPNQSINTHELGNINTDIIEGIQNPISIKSNKNQASNFSSIENIETTSPSLLQSKPNLVTDPQTSFNVISNDFQQDNSSQTIQIDILNDPNLDNSNPVEIAKTNDLFSNTDPQTLETKSTLDRNIIDVNPDKNSDNNTANISNISIQKTSNISEINPEAFSQSVIQEFDHNLIVSDAENIQRKSDSINNLEREADPNISTSSDLIQSTNDIDNTVQNIDDLDILNNSDILNTNISHYSKTNNINNIDIIDIQKIQRKSEQDDHITVTKSFNTNNSQNVVDSDRNSTIQPKSDLPQLETISQSEIFQAETANQLETTNEPTVIQRLSDPANLPEDLTLPTVLQNLGQTEPLGKFSSLTDEQLNHGFTTNNVSNPSQLLQGKGNSSNLSSSISNISTTPTPIQPKHDQNQSNDAQDTKSPSWSNIAELLAKMPPPKVSSNPSTNSLSKKEVSSSDRSSLASQSKSSTASTSNQTQTIIQRSPDDRNDDDLDLYITPSGLHRGNPNQLTNSQVNTIQRKRNSNQGNENLPEATVSVNNPQDDDSQDAANFEKNLTALAQEIYVLLQQRLEIEKERQGSRYQGRLPW